MTKRTVDPDPDEGPTPPRTINLALAAICAQLGFAALDVLLQFVLGDQLRRSIISDNKTKKSPSVLCDVNPAKGCLDPGKAVHTIQLQTAIGTVLLSVVIVMLAFRIRRGVRSGRTMYIAASVIGAFVGFAGSPLAILAVVASGSILLRGAASLAALAAMVAMFLLFMRESQAYFAKLSPRPGAGPRAGARAAAGTPARRPGLMSLLRPPPAAQRKQAPDSASGSAGGSAAAARAAAKGTGARAKARTDEAAVARGAELARNRAKASKSRRTEL